MGRDHLSDLGVSAMLAVMRLGEGAYSVPIQELLGRAGRKLSPGAVFATLDRLEEKGFLSSRLGEPIPERGGRRKRYYKVTAKGQQSLTAAIAERQALQRGLDLGKGLVPEGA
ncbi:MAG TPA: PadR family transcriptional regulator [Stellaceae bacterium]|nr:PadR family transcriptional regulator [Stellaceae bacterium]